MMNLPYHYQFQTLYVCVYIEFTTVIYKEAPGHHNNIVLYHQRCCAQT